MVTAEDFRQIALSLPNTTEAPHFDRIAFRTKRIFATLARDGETANLMFSPETQALKCEMMPDVFRGVPNKWGDRGATTMMLHAADLDDVRSALVLAHADASAKRR